MTSPLFTCTHFPVNLTTEQAELIANPIEFHPFKQTYNRERVIQVEDLFSEIFGPSVFGCDDDIQEQAFKDGLGMLGQEYSDNGAAHFAIASDGSGGYTAYHIKTLGGKFTAHAEFYFDSTLNQSWAEALQIIENKADWGIRGVASDVWDEQVRHDDGPGSWSDDDNSDNMARLQLDNDSDNDEN
jgi:hypothetical protein